MARKRNKRTSRHKCNLCGLQGVWTIGDGGDYFCSEEHQETFSANGDSTNYPAVTKEELDQELDEIYQENELKHMYPDIHFVVYDTSEGGKKKIVIEKD